MKDIDDIPVNPSDIPPVCSLLSRRLMLKLGAAGLGTLSLDSSAEVSKPKEKSFLPFKEVSPSQGSDINLADGLSYKTLISFGDPLKSGMDTYDSSKLTGEEQKSRFGGSCDYTHFFQNPTNENEGVLCVNNESPEFGTHPDRKEREKAAYYSVGCSIVSLKKDSRGEWKVNLNSKLNRKITPATPAVITGPAAGNDRLKNSFSQDGVKSAGTVGNCAGGNTPWGTYLTAEENIQSFFSGDASKHVEKENMKRFGMKSRNNFFQKIDNRFNLQSDAQSPLHFGWVVEIDPLSPDEPIKKHTMLGRAKHECAEMVIDKNGHAVVYTSDDQAFEYIYKFVSKYKFKEGDRSHNKTLLEEGILYVAKFSEDYTIKWIPLIFGQGPLVKGKGFLSQGDVLLDTRKAADLLGATPMDRPEDIAIHPETGQVYFFMTGNRSRKADQVNSANKVPQGSGHIIEMSGNHHEPEAKWSFLVICGQDMADNKNSLFHKGTSLSGRFVYPDNGAFDQNGELWVCSDGYGFPGFSDGLWHCSISGERGLSKRMATAPKRSEFTGPCFMKDGKSLILAVQHPGTNPKGSFPDFDKSKKARSAIVIINRKV